MKNFRMWLLLLLSCNIFLALSACSSAINSGTVTQYDSSKIKGSIAIAVAGSAQEIAVRQKAVDGFTAKYPAIKVKLVDIGNDRFQKTLAMVASKTAPDILYINEMVPSYAARNIVLPLDDIIAKDPEFKLASLYPNLVKATTYQGKIYGLPQEVSPFVIYYNKKLFDEKKVAYPTDEMTLEQFYELAKKMTDKSKNIYGYRIYGSGWFDQLYMFAAKEGATLFNNDFTKTGLDSTQALEGLRFMNRIFREGISPTPSEGTAMGKTADNLFRNSQLAMEAMGLWMLPVYKDQPLDFDWDVVRMPKNPNAPDVNAAGILNWSIYKGSKNLNAAWALLKYLVSTDGQLVVAQSGMALPSSSEAEANASILQLPAPKNIKAFVDSANTVYFEPSLSAASLEVKDNYARIVEKMANGDLSPEDTQKELVNTLNPIIAKVQH